MDELERALRAVLDDPAQMRELRELAGSMGFSAPQMSRALRKNPLLGVQA